MEAILSREIVSHKTARRAVGVAAFVVLTALGAFIRIPLPFTPVPLTLQTFFVLLGGLFLGGRLGALAQLTYVILGMAGLPIFTGAGSGAVYLLGPTGGYLFGFVVAALIAGISAYWGIRGFFSNLLILCLADAVLLSCGALWLMTAFGYSIQAALAAGFLPFVAGDLLKASAAAAVYSCFSPRINKLFGPGR